jgi:(S)-mandelate dehydrogenase
MKRVMRAYNIDDLATLARRRLPAGLFEYIDRGAEDEATLHENLASLKRVFLKEICGERLGRQHLVRMR